MPITDHYRPLLTLVTIRDYSVTILDYFRLLLTITKLLK